MWAMGKSKQRERAPFSQAGLMPLTPSPEPVNPCPNKSLRGLAGKSQLKATGGAEDKVRKETQGQGGGAGSEHGQTEELDINPGVW